MKARYKTNAAAVAALFVISSSIIILGVAFAIYAVLNNISFSVMSANIPGALFAAVVVFLGVRYFIATLKLKDKIKGLKFSWKHFRKQINEDSMKGGA